MRIAAHTAILALLFGAMGCEQIVIVDVPPHESQLVAKGLFTPDSLWTVHVSASVGFQETTINAVTNATVSIWEQGDRLEVLQPTTDGTYRAARTYPTAGETYELRVEAPGYTPVLAEATLLPPTVAPRFNSEQSRDEFGFNTVDIDITVTDPGDRENYYAIDVYQPVVLYDEIQGRETIVLVPTGFESSDIVLRGVDAFDEAEYFDAAFFTDELFDGQEETVTIRVFTSFFDEPDRSFFPNYIVRLRTTDEDFYRYHRTIQLQHDLGDNPFAEPVRIHSNTSNGFGIFAGYHSFTYVLPL